MAEAEVQNVKNVRCVNKTVECKRGRSEREGVRRRMALNSWHVRAATPTQRPRGKQIQ